MAAETSGKRVSWVELYFDLIFVFAVGQTAHIMVADPRWAGLGRALGLFIPLWWAWIGFVVLYNRHGEDQPVQRLFVLAGTLPCTVAAVETHAASDGHATVFVFALAAIRLVLALAFVFTVDQARWVAIGLGLSAVAFAASAFVPAPWRFALWAFALFQEAGHLLLRGAERGAERRSAPRGRVEGLRSMLEPPKDPARRVDAAHLAERFGLMMIILLGEVVVAVAGSAAGVEGHDAGYWIGLSAGLVLAAAAYWIYFTAAAPASESVLRASGGNPTMAYAIYAGGHLSSAFALLSMAAGVSLALSGEAPSAAVWFLTGGLAAYLLGTRSLIVARLARFGRLSRIAVAAITVCLAFLEPLISTTGVVLLTAAWAVALAAFVTWRLPTRLRDIAADPLAYFDSTVTTAR